MAVFVDLSEEDSEPPQNGFHGQSPWPSRIDAVHPAPIAASAGSSSGDGTSTAGKQREEAQELGIKENPNRNSMTQALGCYPIIMSVAIHIDLNTLDNLSRTCRQIREGLLQYRKMLLISTLHCINEPLPVDPDQTLRYRARAGNWFYMRDDGRTGYSGKPGQCARDLVGECRQCKTVVCRNCAIKPPAPIVLRNRHRRLCQTCVAAPLGTLVKPPLGPEVSIDSDDMQREICVCDSQGVWLCQPCGRSILSDDSEYKCIWRWRNQYTEVLGGLGTGIGEGDRGVICGRETECFAAREREQETDGDAEDAREVEHYLLQQQQTSSGSSSSNTSSSSLAPPGGGGGSNSPLSDRRTPSPALKPGYARHEIEGIGGVMKKKLVRMVRVGACVPEWEDERAKGEGGAREEEELVWVV
ncbi:hypothetical protein N0V88_002432 [Collariella sp. IMI 366227]|nr:hypothetical protein N0V88_002432 [Collariella sp. IMI 366227]